MINNEQIAHDLAIAKLYGSDLPNKEFYKTYLQYKDDFLKIINEEPVQLAEVKIIKRPF